MPHPCLKDPLVQAGEAKAALGLARVCARRTEDAADEAAFAPSFSFYSLALAWGAPRHAVAVECGGLLCNRARSVGDGRLVKEAISLYSDYLSNADGTRDARGFVCGELAQLLQAQEQPSHPALVDALIGLGQEQGIGRVEPFVQWLLRGKHWPQVRRVYAGIAGKPEGDPQLAAFFKRQGWLGR